MKETEEEIKFYDVKKKKHVRGHNNFNILFDGAVEAMIKLNKRKHALDVLLALWGLKDSDNEVEISYKDLQDIMHLYFGIEMSKPKLQRVLDFLKDNNTLNIIAMNGKVSTYALNCQMIWRGSAVSKDYAKCDLELPESRLSTIRMRSNKRIKLTD